ncbi:MAG: histidine kinase [Flavobacteriaceae bacterium]|nr:histidine kinase [Flavobacteriaceae bacterium]
MLKIFQSTEKKIPIIYHFVFWISYFSFNVIRWGSYFNDYWYSIKSNAVEFPLHIIIVYFNIYYLVPKFILKKQDLKYFIYLILSLAVLYVVRTELTYYLVNENIWPEAVGHQEAFTFNHIVAVTLGEVYVLALATVIKLTIDWVSEKRRNEELLKIQLKTELNFLKSQIQPHFFFNTLNNLYALAIEKSDKVPDVILKLSEIMQYVLYDVKDSKIDLLKEINYIYSYLELEKLRYGDNIDSKIDIKGNIDNLGVPPLLFMPFIENCFKHGIDNNSISVKINFNRKKKFLLFNVENSFVGIAKTTIKHGIGLKNVKRRLQLLYQSNFRLRADLKDNKYIVNLIIPIT